MPGGLTPIPGRTPRLKKCCTCAAARHTSHTIACGGVIFGNPYWKTLKYACRVTCGTGPRPGFARVRYRSGLALPAYSPRLRCAAAVTSVSPSAKRSTSAARGLTEEARVTAWPAVSRTSAKPRASTFS